MVRLAFLCALLAGAAACVASTRARLGDRSLLQEPGALRVRVERAMTTRSVRNDKRQPTAMQRRRNPRARSLQHSDVRSSHAKRDEHSDVLFSASSIIAPMQIGTPPQNVWVLLDTASSDLAVFDADYAAQYHPSKDASQQSAGESFKSAMSSSYVKNGYSFTNNYGSGSTATTFTAVQSTDTVAFQSLVLAKQPLGVIHQGNVSYGPKAAGIMGLAFEGASSGLKATPVVQQLYFSGALKEPVFSFALIRPSTTAELISSDDKTQPGGIFTLGTLDSQQYEGNIGWSTVVSTALDSQMPSKWLAKIDSLSINGMQIKALDGAVANFDTGSSASRASAQLLSSMLANVKNSYKDDAGNYYVPCGSTSSPAMKMTLAMGGVSIEIEPLDLLFKTTAYTVGKGSEKYCMTTLATTSSTEYDLQLGDDVMRSLYVAFSFSPPRVGIAQQSEAVKAEQAKAQFAFQGNPISLGSTGVTTVQKSSNADLVDAKDVNSKYATTHMSTNADGQSLMPGGVLLKGHTATMLPVKASTTAKTMQTRSADQGDAASDSASNTPAPGASASASSATQASSTAGNVDTSGLNPSPSKIAVDSTKTSGASSTAHISPVVHVFALVTTLTLFISCVL